MRDNRSTFNVQSNKRKGDEDGEESRGKTFTEREKREKWMGKEKRKGMQTNKQCVIGKWHRAKEPGAMYDLAEQLYKQQ